MSTLNPNRFAGPAEAALLRDDIAADEAARAALRERAKRAQTALHDANEAVRAAQEAAASAQQSVDHITQLEHIVDERLAVSRGLLHPIRRLPDELLAMIFTLRPIFYSMSRPVPCLPFALAAVCRRWRRVALSTPALWATLSCSIKDFHDIEAERSYASYLRYYLVRSSNIPLSISVDYEAENRAAHGPLWLAISELYRRAQTFYFSSAYHCDTTSLLESVLSYRAPHLEDLELHNTEFADDNEDTLLRLRPDTPRLETFECQGSPLMWLIGAPLCPSVRTVVLNTVKFDVSHMVELFRHFPNIDSLDANVFHELSSPGPVVIRADYLETLRIRLSYGVKDIALAQSFSFPSLREAYVEMGDVGELHADATSTFIRSAFATVTILHFKDHVADGTCSGLRSCPRLEDLWLTCYEFKHDAEDTITALSAPGPNGAWMCPQLQTLTLSVWKTNDRLVEKVTALATARRMNAPSGPPSALETLNVKFRGDSWRAHPPSLQLQEHLDTILQSV
ncbi:hypothetical protein EXIGLDRAFT_697473 [Exidia glandulosa HHB12029]|uniref:F-box domain-containing protein n=1 Tax=Exidia glandulosa HHB12029 TaxID=1314781 RepID=A0A165ES80_EXIGL|nr:hypothetical protein EXIGLDRAFT_697473 [Exidia glandulosa HHB12029]